MELQSLEKMGPSGNQLYVAIARSIDSLSTANRFILTDNKMSKSLQSEIGRLQNLKSINIDKVAISEMLPTHIGVLSNMDAIFGGNNLLLGCIPTYIGEATKLQVLSLKGNNL
jgi:Leucine-rich repeat (LRR) protein